MARGVCKLCDLTGELCRAHIIPEWAYRPAIDRVGHALRLDETTGTSKKVQTGEFDREILCPRCDGQIGEFDRYAKRQLLDYDWATAMAESPLAPSGVAVDNYDYPKLKLFFLSVLWRMAITTRAYFERVTLGPFADPLKRMIRTVDPGSMDDYAVSLARFRGPAKFDASVDPKGAILSPCRTRLDGLNVVRIHLGEFTAMVKVDQRPLGGGFRELCLAPGRPLFIALREFDKSPELRAMWEVSRKIP